MKKMLVTMAALLPLTGCVLFEPDYQLSDVSIRTEGFGYAEVQGKIELVGVDDGAVASVMYYSDEYDTLIVETTQDIGEDLAQRGDIQEFSITHGKVAIAPATNGYSRVCARLQVTRTEGYDSYQDVGCTAQRLPASNE
jgi:hypothetical protein